MSVPVDDPGGGVISKGNVQASALPATSDWAGGRGVNCDAPKKLRSFEEIIADAKCNRNILEINLKKNTVDDQKPPNLTFDQIGELLFDRLKINSDDCLRFNFSSHRYDTREVFLKPNIDLSPYITEIDDFYGHSITTKRQSSKITRVSFRNVPLNVPDEEIIHLCSYYGKPVNNQVEYEKIVNKWGTFQGSTRFVDMEISPGSRFMNYYWLEGPLPGDRGCRITVLHSGQERQCSHCLRTMSNGCPGQGQGKVCKLQGTPMGRMTEYMLFISKKLGYESLKNKHLKSYPVLGGNGPSDAMDKHDDEADEDEEANDSDINSLKQKLVTVEKELEETRHASDQRLHQYKRSSDLAKNKIVTATRCLNMYLGETLMTEKVDEFSTTFKFLVSQYSSLLFTPEGYTVDPDTNSITLNENLFSDLKGDDNFDFVKEKVKVFENHLKEKLSMDLSIRRERRLSSVSLNRSRLPSLSIKRSHEESNGNPNKLSRPSTSE